MEGTQCFPEGLGFLKLTCPPKWRAYLSHACSVPLEVDPVLIKLDSIYLRDERDGVLDLFLSPTSTLKQGNKPEELQDSEKMDTTGA